MAEDGFRLPRSSYDEVRNIIVAYGHLSEPGNLDDVAGYGRMSRTTVSRNNGFLLSIGVLEPGKRKGLSKPGKRLADAIEHGIPEEIAKRWRTLIAESDFLQKVLAAVKIRKGMERSALESHIAYTAGEKKTARVMTGAGTLVEILMEAGLLKQENGKLLAVQGFPGSDDVGEEEEPRRDQFTKPSTQELIPDVRVRRHKDGLPICINIDVTVSCSAKELGQLGIGLRQLINDLYGSAHSAPEVHESEGE